MAAGTIRAQFEFFRIQRLTRGLCDFNTAVAFLVM